MRGHLDGDRYYINLVILDHHKGVRKPALGAEGLSRFPGAPLVASRHSREPKTGNTFDRRNMRILRPASFGVCSNDSDTNFILSHSSTSPFCNWIEFI